MRTEQNRIYKGWHPSDTSALTVFKTSHTSANLMIILVYITLIIPILFSYFENCSYLHTTVTTHEVPSSIKTVWHKNLIIIKVSYCENKKILIGLKKKCTLSFTLVDQ